MALTKPAVKMLAPTKLPLVLTKPLEVIDVNVPTDVMLFCAAVVNVPAIFVPDKLPPVMLPVALIKPPVRILAPVTLPAILAEVA